jgi:hypothetical protein
MSKIYSAAIVATALAGVANIPALAQDNNNNVSGILRAHALSLADGTIKFNKLPEIQAAVTFGDITLNFNGDIIHEGSENFLDPKSLTGFQIGNLNLAIPVNNGGTITIGANQYAFANNFAAGWLQSAVDGLEIEPQILGEAGFETFGIDSLTGVKFDQNFKLPDGNWSAYVSGAAGARTGINNPIGVHSEHKTGGVSGYVSVDFTRALGKAKLGLGAEVISRDVGGAVNENIISLRASWKQSVTEQFVLRADTAVARIENHDGVRGASGDYSELRAFADWLVTENLRASIGAGTFNTVAGKHYQALEGTVAYEINRNWMVHGGVGYANGGGLKGGSTTIGLTCSF